jgi:predicted site-specific integrase-resolvase
MSIVAIGQVAKSLGVCVLTVRRWHREGKLLPSFTTVGGHRRYEIDKVKMQFETVKDDRITIGYCRVSSSDQLSDLETQKEVVNSALAERDNSQLISDKGSGINFKKRGLLELLDKIISGDVKEVFVTHKDRLVRFGFELIERIASHFGTRITILMSDERVATFEEELAKDLITIITVFSSRLYGKRSHKNKKLAAAKNS